MKKRYIVATTALVALGLGTSACSNPAGNGGNKQATSKNANKLEKTLNKADKEAKEKAKPHSTNKFIGNTFKTSKGSIKIEKLTNITLKNATSDGDQHYVIIDASFTNSSKKAVSPASFFEENLKVEEKLPKSSHELGQQGVYFEEDLPTWKEKFETRDDKLDPDQTVDFAVSYQLDDNDGNYNPTDTYLIQPYNNDSMETYSKPLKISVSSTQTITAPKKSYDD